MNWTWLKNAKFWAIVLGVVTTVGVLVGVLTYFGIVPPFGGNNLRVVQPDQGETVGLPFEAVVKGGLERKYVEVWIMAYDKAGGLYPLGRANKRDGQWTSEVTADVMGIEGETAKYDLFAIGVDQAGLDKIQEFLRNSAVDKELAKKGMRALPEHNVKSDPVEITVKAPAKK